MKKIVCLLVTILISSALWGCAETVAEREIDWPESTYKATDFSESGVIMEMAFEIYGPEDLVVSHILINTGPEPVTFDDSFNLEYYMDGKWLRIPLLSEPEKGESYTLPGLQACKVYVNLSLFDGPLPEGRYRVVRVVGGALHQAEFILADSRIDAREMSFGHSPLISLPSDYDGIDAVDDGYYTIIEDGVFNQEALLFFADRVHLGVPAKLRTVMHAPDGAVLIRDIVYAPDFEGNDRFLVVYADSRRMAGTEWLVTESVYSNLSIAKIGNKHKVCLSNYVSHILDAPAGAPFELLSPNTSDNIDLVATVELRTEENVKALAHKFLIFGPDGESFAVIERGGNTFGYRFGGASETGIAPDSQGVTLKTIKWVSATQFNVFGQYSDGQSFQTTYELGTAN